MARTVGDLIRSSLIKIGVLDAGEPLDPGEGEDAKQNLIQMLDAWALEELLVPVVSVVTKELSSEFSQYTIGSYPEPKPDPLPGNHIETARPEQIVSAFVRDSYNTDTPIKTMSVTTFNNINVKDNVSIPSAMYTRKGWPLNTIAFNCLPLDGYTLHMEVIQPLSDIISASELTEVVNLPPGYEQAIIYNLCIVNSDDFGRQISQAVAITASDLKRKIKRNNSRQITQRVDRALLNSNAGTYDISSGPC